MPLLSYPILSSPPLSSPPLPSPPLSSRLLSCQAELQTERQRIVLADSSSAPIERLQAGGRHDFTIEHDIKEIGAHT